LYEAKAHIFAHPVASNCDLLHYSRSARALAHLHSGWIARLCCCRYARARFCWCCCWFLRSKNKGSRAHLVLGDARARAFCLVLLVLLCFYYGR